MARYNGEFTMEIVDVNGDTANVRIPVNVNDTAVLSALATEVATMVTAVIACSNGKVIRSGLSFLLTEAQFLVGTTPPTDSKYPSVTDGARLNFANSLGERSSITIPAPLESDFGAGSMVVDSTDTNVAALIAAYEAQASGKSGNFLNLYKGGIKVGRRARRRRTSLLP